MINVHSRRGVPLVFYKLPVPLERSYGGSQGAVPFPMIVAGETLHAFGGAVEEVGGYRAVVAELVTAPHAAATVTVTLALVTNTAQLTLWEGLGGNDEE